jgi:hypothetical protein
MGEIGTVIGSLRVVYTTEFGPRGVEDYLK